MRPEKFNYLIRKAFSSYFREDSTDKFMPLKKEMYRRWKKLTISDGDGRNGFESYGYDDPEVIASSMFYISDRWCCAFRIKWLLDGLEMGKIK